MSPDDLTLHHQRARRRSCWRRGIEDQVSRIEAAAQGVPILTRRNSGDFGAQGR